MKDRSVEYPNRYRMTLVPGTKDVYELTPAPGEVYEDGTFMSKANILDDDSEMKLWGVIGDRTPNDAFSLIGKLLRDHDQDIANLRSDHDQDIANLRSDHDQDIANLTASLEGKIITGTYTGNGAASRTISLGVTPRAVLIIAGTTLGDGSNYHFGGLAVTGTPAKVNGAGAIAIEIVTNGFVVYYNTNSDVFLNHPSYAFTYLVAT